MWGIFVGFAVAVPIGPVGLICIQRTLAKNRLSGLVSGLGAAIADVLLASVGAFSITIIFSFINNHQSVLQMGGGVIMILLGTLSLISKPRKTKARIDTALGRVQEFGSAFILTITNPLSAFSFFIAFGAISGKIGGGWAVAAVFIIGIFIGSCLWWILLTLTTDRIAHRISQERMKSINKWFAVSIVILGLIIFCGAIIKF